MNTIERLIQTIHAEPWKKPELDHPAAIKQSDLEELLGTARGRQWYRTKRWNGAELSERPALLNDRATLPDLPVLQVEKDGRTYWRTFEISPPGTFAGLDRVFVRRAPTLPKAHRPVDLLGLAWLAERQPERIFAPVTGGAGGEAAVLGAALRKGGVRPDIRPAQPPARGAEAILERLRGAKAEVRLSASGDRLVVTASDGRPQAGVVELVNMAERLLIGYLRGAPVPCEVTNHKTPVPAVTIVLGGAAACADCLAATKSEAGAA